MRATLLFLVLCCLAYSECKTKRCFPLISTNVGRTAFVDIEFGSDDTGELEELGCPFKTLNAAISAVISERNPAEKWNVEIRPGNYSGDLVIVPNNLEIIGSGISTIILGRMLFTGAGSSTLRSLTIINTIVNQAAIETTNGGQLLIKDLNIVNEVASVVSLSGVIIRGGTTVNVDDSRITVNRQVAFGVVIVSGTFNANNIFLQLNATLRAAGIVAGALTNSISIRNSAASISFPVEGQHSFITIETGLDALNIISDNNVVSFFAGSIVDNVTPYDAFDSVGTLVSHANVFRDRNSNIDTMNSNPSTMNFIELEDFVDISA